MGEEKLDEVLATDNTEGAMTPEPVRKKAPRMQVRTARGNDRQAYLDELNAQNPEYEHQYRQAGTPADKIYAQGFEVVPGKTRGDEIVVRTMKDSFEEWIAESNSAEADKMERGVDDSGKMVQRLKASPKSPVKD